MGVIIKQEIKNYIKNPLYWIGIIIVIFGVYKTVGPYLNIHYFESDQEIESLVIEDESDREFIQGYIPSSVEWQLKTGLAEIKDSLMKDLKMSEKDADVVIKEVGESNTTIPEISEYLETNYQYYGSDYIFDKYEYRKADKEEANAYLKDMMKEHTYSFYFSRKFADFSGLFLAFFAAVMLAFLFVRDTRRDTYELLHTKPIGSKSYIFGKVAGGLVAVVLVLVILTAVFGGMCMIHGKQASLPVDFRDMIFAAVCYVLPNLLMITSIYAGLSLLFKNPLPAVPLLFLYMIYSNMGSRGPDGRYGYYGRPLAIMVRFPGNFFDTAPPPLVVQNQISLVISSAVLIGVAVFLWKRRRVY